MVHVDHQWCLSTPRTAKSVVPAHARSYAGQPSRKTRGDSQLHGPGRGDGEVAVGQALDQVEGHVNAGG